MIKKNKKKRRKNSNSCHVEEIPMYPHKSYLMSTFGMDETVLSTRFQIQKKYKFRLQKYISINTNEDQRRNHGEQSSGRFCR